MARDGPAPVAQRSPSCSSIVFTCLGTAVPPRPHQLRYAGIDWAEEHHDLAIVNADGDLLLHERVPHDAAGLTRILQLLASTGVRRRRVPIAIETDKGLLVAGLRAAEQPVFAINPMVVARYRNRRGVGRKKSDPTDAQILADILRTDGQHHRPLPDDSLDVRRLRLLVHAHLEAVQAATRVQNQLRSLLREYHPGFLEAFWHLDKSLTRADARAVLAHAYTPARARRLTPTRLRKILVDAGRRINLTKDAERLHEIFTTARWRQPPLLEETYGSRALILLEQLNQLIATAGGLAEQVQSRFAAHPHARILLSFPGLGTTLATRILAELGDDPTRFETARGLKAYAGAAPLTWASGTSNNVTARRFKNARLAGAGYMWAFASLQRSPGAYAYYKKRKEAGERHAGALRRLFGKFLGQLHHCLANNLTYDETTAWPPPVTDTHGDIPPDSAGETSS